MPRAADPFQDTTRLLVDGTNLLHALAQGKDRLPSAAVIGRIRALVPPGVAVTIVLDGPPAPGAHERRVTSGIEVRHSNRRPADDVLRDLVALAPEGALVVTDDRELGHGLRMAGARLASTSWLAERLGRQRLEAPAAARARPPMPTEPSGDIAPTTRRWKPGRGATKKTGNPKRGRPPA
jgi:hypothetical protein